MVVFSPQEKLNNHYNTFLRFSGENSLKISENQQKRLKRTKKCLEQLSGARSTQKSRNTQHGFLKFDLIKSNRRSQTDKRRKLDFAIEGVKHPSKDNPYFPQAFTNIKHQRKASLMILARTSILTGR